MSVFVWGIQWAKARSLGVHGILGLVILLLAGCSVIFESSDSSSSSSSTHARIWGNSSADHMCASKGNRLYCWGSNLEGQLGTGNEDNVGFDEPADTVLPAIEFEDPIQQVALAANHTCVLSTRGELFCWGFGESGALGYGSGQNRLDPYGEPNVVPIGSPIDAVSLGTATTCVVMDNELRCWGNGDGPILCALHECGSNRGDSAFPSELDSAVLDGPVKSVAAGPNHGCALLEDDRIQCFGHSVGGQLGDDTTTGTRLASAQTPGARLQSLSLGAEFACGVDPVGHVRCWGRNTRGQLGVGGVSQQNSISGAPATGLMYEVTKVVVGKEHTCALFGEEALVQCWGAGDLGALGRGDNLTIGDDERIEFRDLVDLAGVVDVAAGPASTCVVLKNDEIACWGFQTGQQSGAGILGSGQNCEALMMLETQPCSYGDVEGEPISDAYRLHFDWK